MQISDSGLKIIKKHEGLKLQAYKCPAGIWTIGYGHTHQVSKGDVIDGDMATEYLKKDVRHAQETIRRLVTVSLEQHRFDALVSFIFNVGAGNFSSSTLLKMMNKGNFEGAEDQFKRWNKARVKGKLTPLRGLTRRRGDEANLFGNHELDDMPQFVAAPAVKTKLKSKTNLAAVTGGVGVLASQADAIGGMMDKVKEISDKGGDFVDKFGAVLNSSWFPFIAIGVVIVLGYIIFERNKKVDEYGL
ncbi:MAG: lysozyme [Rhizobiales bacterium]|nr:lysozyme [Hyphomicrobiales bacterium]